jgi:hypothetical protein
VLVPIEQILFGGDVVSRVQTGAARYRHTGAVDDSKAERQRQRDQRAEHRGCTEQTQQPHQRTRKHHPHRPLLKRFPTGY